MKTLDKGQDKIKKIADGIRQEVLEPSKKEAEKIIEEANKKAEQIVKNAENHAKKIVDGAKQSIEHERNVFLSSLSQSAKQTLESLRQSIESLFNKHLENVVNKQTTDPKVIANLISAIVEAIKKEGLSTEISAVIPRSVSPQAVNQLILSEILSQLKDQGVSIGGFEGGAKVKLVDKQLTLDITDDTLVECLRQYVRKDFRKLIFCQLGY